MDVNRYHVLYMSVSLTYHQCDAVFLLLNLDQVEQNILWLLRLSRAVAKDQNKSAITRAQSISVVILHSKIYYEKIAKFYNLQFGLPHSLKQQFVIIF